MVAQLNSVNASSCESCTGDSCKKCTGHIWEESFTVKNFLPAGDSNLYMECSCLSRCGKLTVQDPVDIKECNSVIISTRFCGPTPQWGDLSEIDAYRSEQVMCEFVWTRPNSETIYRTPVMVWTSGGPERTFYKVNNDGFWFSDGADAQWNAMSGWTMWNYISSESQLKGAGNSVFETFGNEHCRTKNYA
ncbi:hypothetical protein AXG93_2543s1130 [Marchantia polymorpha subsp. ruderalis]|nr:hypothetical protein AXG93_2543s1130 [Marchantia polymorpha subsp. ruderalis]